MLLPPLPLSSSSDVCARCSAFDTAHGAVAAACRHVDSPHVVDATCHIISSSHSRCLLARCHFPPTKPAPPPSAVVWLSASKERGRHASIFHQPGACCFADARRCMLRRCCATTSDVLFRPCHCFFAMPFPNQSDTRHVCYIDVSCR